jgi:hypothetical protein
MSQDSFYPCLIKFVEGHVKVVSSRYELPVDQYFKIIKTNLTAEDIGKNETYWSKL